MLDNTAIVEAVKGMPFASKLKDDVLRGLAEMLKVHNGYIQKFVQAAAIDAPEVAVQIHGRPGPQARSYMQEFPFVFLCSHLVHLEFPVPNAPRAPEIAVIIPDERSQDIAANPRDIIVRAQGDGRLQPWGYFLEFSSFRIPINDKLDLSTLILKP